MIFNFDALPDELRAYPNWVCWQLANKIPVNPNNGWNADTTNEATWGAYPLARAMAEQHNLGVGFVCGKRDPYGFVDLDATADEAVKQRQYEIYNLMNTYSETSPGGLGAHAIFRLKYVEDKAKLFGGRRTPGIEMYFTDRYMTMTGNIVAGRNQIFERGEQAAEVWASLRPQAEATNGAAAAGPSTTPDLGNDREVYDRIVASPQGAYFLDLWNGRWQHHFPDTVDAGEGQSVADQAIVNILWFWSRNDAQSQRMFYACALGQRKKARRKDYWERTLAKAKDRDIDWSTQAGTMDDIRARFAAGEWSTNGATAARGAGSRRLSQGDFQQTIQPGSQTVRNNPATDIPHANGHVNHDAVPPTSESIYTTPDGFFGQLVWQIYINMPRPNLKIAIAGAHGLMSGICGRTFLTDPYGLSPASYTLLVAPTGIGKDGMHRGISDILKSASMHNAQAIMQFLGPSTFGSENAYIKTLNANPSFVSLVGEWGHSLEQMSDVHAPHHIQQNFKALTNLYNKGGRGGMIGEISYSDRAKNTLAVERPAMSLLAEANTASFNKSLTRFQVDSGFLPRLVIFECNDEIPPLNRNYTPPNPQLTNWLAQLGMHSLDMNRRQAWATVAFDAQAAEAEQTYENDIRLEANKYRDDPTYYITRAFKTRAHVNAIKLAINYAVGFVDYSRFSLGAPITGVTITLNHFEWARRIVDASVDLMVEKFKRGDAGYVATENEHAGDVLLELMADFINLPLDQLRHGPALPPDVENMQRFGAIPHGWLGYVARQRAPFRGERTANKLITDTMRELQDSGLITIQSASGNPMWPNSQGRLYVVTNRNAFNDVANKRRRR